MRTNQIGRHDPDKTVWWIVDLGGVYSIYSIHIMFKNYPGYGTISYLYLYIFKNFIFAEFD